MSLMFGRTNADEKLMSSAINVLLVLALAVLPF